MTIQFAVHDFLFDTVIVVQSQLFEMWCIFLLYVYLLQI